VTKLNIKKLSAFMTRGVLFAFFGSLAACSALLPHGEEETGGRWTHFDDVMQSYEEVEPFVSTKDDLVRLGFSPNEQPNVKILNHIEVLDRLMPDGIYQNTELPRGVQTCLSAGEHCSAYEYSQQKLNIRRHGSFLADFFNFKRKTETTGWEFTALFVLTGNQVVYKVWSGTPEISKHKESINPLGPLQGVGPALSTEAVKP
jgi:hypothetical protein